MSKQFATQGAASNAQHFCCAGLITLGFFEGYFQNRALDAVDDHGEHVLWLRFAQIGEIAFQLVTYRLLQRGGFCHDVNRCRWVTAQAMAVCALQAVIKGSSDG